MNLPNPDRSRLLEQSISATLSGQTVLCPILDRHLLHPEWLDKIDAIRQELRSAHNRQQNPERPHDPSAPIAVGRAPDILPSLILIDPEVFLGVSPQPIRTQPELITWLHGLAKLRHLQVSVYARLYLARSAASILELDEFLVKVFHEIARNHTTDIVLEDIGISFRPHSWYHMIRLDSGLFFKFRMPGTLVNISPFSPEFVPELYPSVKDVTPDHLEYRGATWEQRCVKNCPLSTKKIEKVEEPKPQPIESDDF